MTKTDSREFIYYHSQKLGTLNKRGWLTINGYEFDYEYCFGQSFCHIRLEVGGDERDLTFSIALPWLMAIWLHLSFPWGNKINIHNTKELGLSIHHWSLWWQLWINKDEWNNKVPKWRDGYFNFLDWLLGKAEYHSNEDIQTWRDIDIPLVEKIYKGKLKLYTCYWKRKRWPWKLNVMERANIEVKEGIPIPGKGENSWDCDDDAIYSLTTKANSYSQAVRTLINNVMETRQRYGGLNWSRKLINHV